MRATSSAFLWALRTIVLRSTCMFFQLAPCSSSSILRCFRKLCARSCSTLSSLLLSESVCSHSATSRGRFLLPSTRLPLNAAPTSRCSSSHLLMFSSRASSALLLLLLFPAVCLGSLSVATAFRTSVVTASFVCPREILLLQLSARLPSSSSSSRSSSCSFSVSSARSASLSSASIAASCSSPIAPFYPPQLRPTARPLVCFPLLGSSLRFARPPLASALSSPLAVSCLLLLGAFSSLLLFAASSCSPHPLVSCSLAPYFLSLPLFFLLPASRVVPSSLSLLPFLLFPDPVLAPSSAVALPSFAALSQLCCFFLARLLRLCAASLFLVPDFLFLDSLQLRTLVPAAPRPAYSARAALPLRLRLSFSLCVLCFSPAPRPLYRLLAPASADFCPAL
uniref:Transmembrane protein n=1 Tax=Vesanto virus TaxID=1955786 RepID=A0A7D4W3E4_9VIRU|nr:hypothetical protein 1 [Vesanto virus]